MDRGTMASVQDHLQRRNILIFARHSRIALEVLEGLPSGASRSQIAHCCRRITAENNTTNSSQGGCQSFLRVGNVGQSTDRTAVGVSSASLPIFLSHAAIEEKAASFAFFSLVFPTSFNTRSLSNSLNSAPVPAERDSADDPQTSALLQRLVELPGREHSAEFCRQKSPEVRAKSAADLNPSVPLERPRPLARPALRRPLCRALRRGLWKQKTLVPRTARVCAV
eukprot:scaffold1421_cov255-Pinguiococcus_pyrenoidosus.AAC.19